MDRRGFLRVLGAAAAALVAPPALASTYGDDDTGITATPRVFAQPVGEPIVPAAPLPQILTGQRRIALYHPSSGESFIGTYWRDGVYDSKAMEQLTWLMRDRARGQRLHQIDPGVFDFIADVARKVGDSEPVHLISGYRAGVPRTRRASKDSRHLEGKAVDIRMPGYNLGKVGREAIAMQRGGVGLYRSSHLHLDTGPVRTWGRG